MANPHPPHAALRLDRPLVLGLLVTFLASVGTGAVTMGIYFITESALGYARERNYKLALASGLVYIVGAVAIGQVLSRATGRLGSTRRIAVLILAALGAACIVPIIAAGGVLQVPPAWSVWATGMSFGLLTGCLWPIVEAFISGGRRDANLRSAIGLFNIVWASAVILAMWLIAPFIADAPMMVFVCVGALHLLAAAAFLRMPPEPPRHLDDSPHIVPAPYRPLLRVTRILLPACYLLIASISPAIPVVMGALGVALTWKGPLFSIWLGARLVAFIAFERWHGWHGKLGPPLIGGLGLIVGFSAAMLSPRAGEFGIAVLVVALCVFGISSGMVYVAALYYGMEVGGGRVDDGGRHEAIIGLGYAAGPAFGLLGFTAVSAESGHQDMAVVLIVGSVALVAVAYAVLSSRRRYKPDTTPETASE